MKFWTIQSENVDNIINEKGYYEADISKSWYLAQEYGAWRNDIVDSLDLAELKKKIALGYNHDLRDLYTLILKSFNKINKTNLKGLVFAFALYDGDSGDIIEIKDIDELYEYFEVDGINPISTLLKSMQHRSRKENLVIYEVNDTNDFNPLFIDFAMYELLSVDSSSRELVYGLKRNALEMVMPGVEFDSPLDKICDSVLYSISEGVLCLGGLWFQIPHIYAKQKLPIIQAHLPKLSKENIINKYPFKINDPIK